jgi:hypothetical protein
MLGDILEKKAKNTTDVIIKKDAQFTVIRTEK